MAVSLDLEPESNIGYKMPWIIFLLDWIKLHTLQCRFDHDAKKDELLVIPSLLESQVRPFIKNMLEFLSISAHIQFQFNWTS